MPDLSDTIEEAAQDPQSASKDGITATSHPLPDLIAADKYLAGKTAVEGTNDNGGPKSGFGALRPARFIPKGHP